MPHIWVRSIDSCHKVKAREMAKKEGTLLHKYLQEIVDNASCGIYTRTYSVGDPRGMIQAGGDIENEENPIKALRLPTQGSFCKSSTCFPKAPETSRKMEFSSPW